MFSDLARGLYQKIGLSATLAGSKNIKNDEKRVSMTNQTLVALWSAQKTLTDNQPLNKQEAAAVHEFLTKSLGKIIPSVRENQLYHEYLLSVDQCSTEENTGYFQNQILRYEEKYLIKEDAC